MAFRNSSIVQCFFEIMQSVLKIVTPLLDHVYNKGKVNNHNSRNIYILLT